MITEDYVSFEIAKLLKEKGFDVPCDSYYTYFESGVTLYKGYLPEFSNSNINHNKHDDRTSRPSQSLALKWLREVHDIHINFDIHWLHFANQKGWMYIVEKILDNGIEYIDSKGDENDATFFSTHEKACEAALLYVLKNLI